jgi:hypothetical protein
VSVLSKLLEGFKSLVFGSDPLSPEETRVSPRILCQYRVNMQSEDQDFKCSIVDIGATGMRLEGVPPLQIGQRFKISYPYAQAFRDDHSFEVEVMWCHQREIDDQLAAGVRYLQSGESLQGTWVYTLLNEVGLIGDAAYRKRQHVRLVSHQKAFLRDLETGHHILEGRVNNISVGGALVESLTDVRSGRTLLALIGPSANYPTLAIHARVVASRPDPEDQRLHLLSLQFIDLTKDELKALQELVMAMLQGRTGA